MKSQKKLTLMIGLSSCIFFLLSVFAFGAPPDNYTCKITVGTLSGTMAKMGNMSRMENDRFEGLVTIRLMDQKKTIIMNTKNMTYFGKAIEERIPSLYDQNVVVEKKEVGSETIDGHPCIKYEASFYVKDRPNIKLNATLWEAQDLGGLPIRHVIKRHEKKWVVERRGEFLPLPEINIHPEINIMGIDSNLKEIKVGAATAAMFEVPKDYRKVSWNEVMGMGKPGDMREMMKQIQKK